MRRIAAGVGILLLCACSSAPQVPADWRAYQAEVQRLTGTGRYRDALPVARQELAAAEKALAPGSAEYARALEDLAEIETTTGHYTDADGRWRAAVDIQRKRADGSLELATALDGLAHNEDMWTHFTEAATHYQEALAIQERLAGQGSPATAESLTGLGHVKIETSAYDEAGELLKRALAIREQAPGPGQLDLVRTLNTAAFLALYNGDDDGARQLLTRSIAILDRPGQPERPELATALDYLGNADLDQSLFADAEPRFQRALRIFEATQGHDHQDVANAYNDLARVNDDDGRYPLAEDYYKRSIALYSQVLGPDNVNVASIKDSLAQMYDLIGDYPRAEPLFQEAIAIDERLGESDLMGLAYDLNNYAQHKKNLGKFAEAEPLMRRTLEIFQKLLPPDHPSIATAINNLSELYTEEAKFEQAEPLAQQALEMTQKAYGADNPVTAVDMNNLAEIYEGEKKYPQAEALYAQSLAIYMKTLRPGHPDLGRQMNNLANLYSLEGKYREAEKLFPKSLKVMIGVYGKENLSVQATQFNYAAEQYASGQWRGADRLFSDYLASTRRLYENLFMYLGEKGRLEFLGIFKSELPVYYSFCLKYHERQPALAGKMYDALLWRKGLVGSSIAALRAKIAASGDPAALALLDQLGSSKTKLATLLNSPGDDHAAWQAEVQRLQQQTDDLEQQLVRRSASLTQEKQLEQVTWQQVRDTLKPGEAAVEFVRFQFNDGRSNLGPDYYVALVLTHETRTAPEFIVIGMDDAHAGAAVADYAGRIRKFGADEAEGKAAFYAAFWRPLEKALGGAKRVYLSPDGILNQASLGVVTDAQGRLLMERYDLRIVPSTRDLLRQPAPNAAREAVLVGNPDFALPPSRYLAALEKLQKPPTAFPQGPMLAAVTHPIAANRVSRDYSVGARCPIAGTGILCPLPGAEAEVTGLDGILQQNRWQTTLYGGDTALEEALKGIHHPRILHIATHGFFLPDQNTLSEDPMLRSGLYFAGADATLGGSPPPEGADDGVLTAYEATQLDLQGTELVVLSACDTGLGTSQNGEGVFGLNRALQEAGAQAVLMSMWSVPDQETRELMQLFYANWLGGMEKHEALRQAELAEREVVKQRYGHDLPYYWGAFVMVGR